LLRRYDLRKKFRTEHEKRRNEKVGHVNYV